ncbi:MAG: fibronectin type III domain-containing protein, partial [Acidimicrobiales bacterium]|nr:fibronectin type III domain-containing protein [Acidimicrobiales bacterium]
MQSHRIWPLIALIAISLATVPVPATAAPAAVPGLGDPDYGVGGFARVPLRHGPEDPVDLVTAKDGGAIVLTSGNLHVEPQPPHYDYPDAEPIVSRLGVDGTPDESFGTDGRVLLDFENALGEPVALTERADGSIVVLGYDAGYAPNAVYTVTLNADGSPADTAADNVWGKRLHGVDGRFGDSVGTPSLHRTTDDQVLVTYLESGSLRVLLLGQDGLQDDPALEAAGGRLPEPARLDSDDRWVSFDDDSVDDSVLVTRRLRDGSSDPSFGIAGAASIPLEGGLRDVAVEDGGSILLLGADRVARVTESGTEDLTFVGENSRQHTALIAAASGFYLGRWGDSFSGDCVSVERRTIDGSVDPLWGVDGVAEHCPHAQGQVRSHAAAPWGDGLALLTSGSNGSLRQRNAVSVLDIEIISPTVGDDEVWALQVADDGSGFALVEGATISGVLALTPDGLRQGAFGDEGFASLDDGPRRPRILHRRADGSLLVGGAGEVVAMDAAGRIDPTFATQSAAVIDGRTVSAIEELADGDVLVVVGGGIVLRLDSSGAPTPWAGFDGVDAVAISADESGFVVVSHRRLPGDLRDRLTMHRFLTSGERDGAFADGGAVELADYWSSAPVTLAVGPDGRILVAHELSLVGVSRQGMVSDALAPETLVDRFDRRHQWLADVEVAPDGSVFVVGGPERWDRTRQGTIAAIHASGGIMDGFGDQGFLEIGPGVRDDGELVGSRPFVFQHLALDGHDRLFVAGTVNHAQAEDVTLGRVDLAHDAPLPDVVATISKDVATESDPGYIGLSVEPDRSSTVGIVFEYEVVGGTATEGQDYRLAATGIRGWGGSGSAGSVHVLDDDLVEGDETVELRLVEADQARGEGQVLTLTIRDDDRAPTPPAQPQPPTLAAGEDQSLVVTVVPPSNEANDPPSSYWVQVWGPQVRTEVIDASETEVIFADLVDGVYRARVAAGNETGVSPWSLFSSPGTIEPPTITFSSSPFPVNGTYTPVAG